MGKRHVDANLTILVWHALVSKGRHIRDMEPELEALATFSGPHKSAMNRSFFLRTPFPHALQTKNSASNGATGSILILGKKGTKEFFFGEIGMKTQ